MFSRFLLILGLAAAGLFAVSPSYAQQSTVSCASNFNNTSGSCVLGTVVTTSAVSGLVIEAGPGNLMTVYATNLTSTAGFLVVLNATSIPSDGAILPLDCVPLPANSSAGSCGPGCTGVTYRPGPGKRYSTGIVAVVTSAATCFTKTTGTITAFISGDAN